MSFLAPKVELPNGLSDNTPGRNARRSPTQVLPLVDGRGRVVVQWVTPVLHWHFRTTGTSQYAFFSCFGVACLGPVDELVRIIVNDKIYTDIAKFREDYPGSAYVDHVLSRETPETYRIWWGEEDHANYSAYLQGLVKDPAHPMYGKAHPSYHGVVGFACKDMEAGQSSGGSTPPLPKVELEVYRRSPAAYSFGYAAHGTHPIGIVKDLLTLQRGGLGLPGSYFDDAKWEAKMEELRDVGVAGATGDELFTSFVFAEPKEAIEQVADVLSYIDGFLIERNGQLEIGYCPNDGSTLDEEGLTVINQDHLGVAGIEDDPGTLDGLPSQVIVNGLEWQANPPLSEAAETAQVPFARQLLGEQRPPLSYNRIGFTSRRQLKSAATLMAAIVMNPDWQATVPILRQYALQPDGTTPLRPGDLFILNVDQVGGINVVVRILSRESDSATEAVFRVRRERGTFPRPYEPTLDTRASITPPPPVDLVRYAMAQFPPDLATTETVLTALVERPSNSAAGYEVHFAPTNSWPGQVLDTLNRWAIGAVLRTNLAVDAADVTATVDTVGADWAYLASQSTLEQDDNRLVMIHGGEWFSVGTITPIGGGQYSVALKRGRLASTPAAHASGDVVFFAYRVTLGELRNTSFSEVFDGSGAYDAGVAEKWFKLRPAGPGGLGNLTAAFSLVLGEPPAVDYGSDLVANADFTRGWFGWDTASGYWDILPTLGEGSTWGAKPNSGSATQLVNRKTFRVQAGERYSLRAHGIGTSGHARITIFNAAGTEIAYINAPAFGSTWGFRDSFGSIPIGATVARAEFVPGSLDPQVDWIKVQLIPAGVAYTPPDEIVPPVLLDAADAGGGLRTITLTNDDPLATLKYQVNGGSVTTYSGPFSVASGDDVRAFAERSGFADSDLGQFTPF